MTSVQKTCFFTGHRVINPNYISMIKSHLNEEILNAVNKGFTHFISGGALGFDTLAAEQVILLREDYNEIELSLYLPCSDQSKNWSEFERIRYDNILSLADEICYTSNEPYKNGCMKKRNEAMAEASDMCIAFLRRLSSGTAQTVKMAQEKGIDVINIAEKGIF